MNVAFGMPRFPLSTSRVAGAAGGADALVEDAEDILATNRNWSGKKKQLQKRELENHQNSRERARQTSRMPTHLQTRHACLILCVGRCPPSLLTCSFLCCPSEFKEAISSTANRMTQTKEKRGENRKEKVRKGENKTNILK